MSAMTQQHRTAPILRGRRSNFIPAPADAGTVELVTDDRRAERVTFVSTIVLAAAALLSTAGFATAIIL